MSDLIKKIKIKKQDGTYTDYIPIGAEAKNVDMKNGCSVQANIGDIDIDSNGNIAEQLNKIHEIATPRVLGLRKTQLNDSTWRFVLQYSYDGLNFIDILLLPKTITCGRAYATNLCHIHDYWYVIVDNEYWVTKDFINWSDKHFLCNIGTNEKVWASFLWDKNHDDSKQIQVFYSYCPNSNNHIMTDFNIETTLFSIRMQNISIDENGILGTFSPNQGTVIIGNETNNSYIDPCLAKVNNDVYLAIKNEISAKIEIYKYNEKTNNIVNTGFSHRGFGIEAPKLIGFNTGLKVYADPFNLRGDYDKQYNRVDYLRQIELRGDVIDFNGNVQTDILWDYVQGAYSAHIAYSPCDSTTLNILDKIITFQDIGIEDNWVNNYYYSTTNAFNRDNALTDSNGYEHVCIINHPFKTTLLTGGTSELKKAYISFERVFKNVPYCKILAEDTNPNYYAGYGINRIFNEENQSNKKLDFPNNSLLTYPIITTNDKKDFIFIKEDIAGRTKILSNPDNITSANFILGENIRLDFRYRYGILIVGWNESTLSEIPFIIRTVNGTPQFIFDNTLNKTGLTLTFTINNISNGDFTITSSDTLWGGVRIIFLN